MASAIDEYLARLRGRLSKRLPAASVEEHLREISNHLQDSISAKISSGEPESPASVNALKDLGSDWLVADSLVRAHSGIERRSVWRLAWLPCALMLCSSLLSTTFGIGYLGAFLQGVERWLPWCFVVTFLIVCVRSRRVLLKPILATAGLAMALLFTEACILGPFGSTPMAVAHRQQMTRFLEHEIQQLRAELEMTHADNGTPYPDVLRSRGGFLAPVRSSRVTSFVDLNAYRDELPFYYLLPQSKELEARSMWRSLYPARVEGIKRHLQEARSNLSSWLKVGPNSSALLELALALVLFSLPAIAVIVAINLLALLAVEMRRRLVMAAWSRRQWV